jgi:hypothetical protein
MSTRPNRIIQTSTEAKKAHKQNGPRLPPAQLRQLERGAELDQRAVRLRENEERRKVAKKRREEREKKEKETRKKSGVGLATQLIGYSHTQAQLKNGMEAFLGFQKRKDQEKKMEDKIKEAETTSVLEADVDEFMKEPWDDEDGDAFELPALGTAGGDQWADDDLDDDTLLEAHDIVMSDPVEEPAQSHALHVLPPLRPVPLEPASKSPKRVCWKDHIDFIRLHGPINKVIEGILDKLPDPLIELLSQDMSKDATIWNPPSSLLHKLNPGGLPPHRLRIKVGCAVSLLRDLNTSSPLSKSQHLQILRMEKDRLECLVLDGQLVGTKTLLTRTAFSACHHNDTRFPFQRVQFPIQVAKDFSAVKVPKEVPQSTFKIPAMPGKPPRRTNVSKNLVPSQPKAQPKSNPNPSFKLPGLPASKSKPPIASRPAEPSPCSILDDWDDFLESGTQIARELSREPCSPIKPSPPAGHAVASSSISTTLPPLSTEDFDFSLEDLDDSPQLPVGPKTTKANTPALLAKNAISTAFDSAKVPKKLTPHSYAPLPSRYSSVSTPQQTSVPLTQKPTMPPPRPRKSPNPRPLKPPPPLKRTSSANRGNASSSPQINSSVKPSTSFSDFGLSTQEAVSFFDDDDNDDDLVFFG